MAFSFVVLLSTLQSIQNVFSIQNFSEMKKTQHLTLNTALSAKMYMTEIGKIIFNINSWGITNISTDCTAYFHLNQRGGIVLPLQFKTTNIFFASASMNYFNSFLCQNLQFKRVL